MRKKYGVSSEFRDDAKLKRLPAESVIQSYINNNHKKGGNHLSNADIAAWATGSVVSCLSDIEGQSDGDKPLVLHQFTRNVQIEDVKTGKMVDVSTSGIVFSTKRLLLYYKSLVTSLKDKPRYFVPTVFADGTYRLVKGTTRSGAVLCDMGLHTIKWEKNMDVERAHYLPLMYMYVQTECYEAYRDFFSTFKHASRPHRAAQLLQPLG